MHHDSRSYSQRKRDQMDYRRVYFSRNPGLFGCVWTCAYCHKPLLGRHSVQVDHIMPLNNPLGMNKSFNLVAACAKCNNDKSDKFDQRVAIGYMSKLLEIILFTLQKIAIVVFVAVWYLIAKMCSGVIKLVSALLLDTGIVGKIILVILVICVIYFVTLITH